LEALSILEEQPELITKLVGNAAYARKGLREKGFQVIDNQTGIVPVIVGSLENALMYWRQLYDRDVFVNAFIPPGVPPNMSMMRTSYMASHEKEHLDRLIEVFDEVGSVLGFRGATTNGVAAH
jgi:8-amino-7-oxononanoate synthase